MRRDRNGVDPVVCVKSRQGVQKEGPVPLDIKMGIGRAGQNRVGTGDDRDLGKVRQVDKGKLGIRLANVDDGNMQVAHGM